MIFTRRRVRPWPEVLYTFGFLIFTYPHFIHLISFHFYF